MEAAASMAAIGGLIGDKLRPADIVKPILGLFTNVPADDRAELILKRR
jgi:hypothetical protein